MAGCKMRHSHRLVYWHKLELKSDQELYDEYMYLMNPIMSSYKNLQRREAFLDFLRRKDKMDILKKYNRSL